MTPLPSPPQQGNLPILLAAAGPGGMTPTTPACRAPPPSGRGTTRAGGAAAAAEEQWPCGRGRPVGRRGRRGAGPAEVDGEGDGAAGAKRELACGAGGGSVLASTGLGQWDWARGPHRAASQGPTRSRRRPAAQE
ncbi:hypothetical protein PLESTF_001084300 [Pleodorina starrii]|nr:hypothetical protein PLESTF_001084300 [Pleodorina starrii]